MALATWKPRSLEYGVSLTQSSEKREAESYKAEIDHYSNAHFVIRDNCWHPIDNLNVMSYSRIDSAKFLFPGSRRSSVEFNMEENYEMDRLGDSRGSQIRRLHTIEELPESDMPITTNEEEMEQSEADLQSELSYASAYSSPVGSLHDGDDRFYQLSETTV